ncbi:MAG: helix-turn-helix domain-containing protein [Paracoccaceae bacterium]
MNTQPQEIYRRRVSEAFYPVEVLKAGDSPITVHHFSSAQRGMLRVTRGHVAVGTALVGRSNPATTSRGSAPDEFVLMRAETARLVYSQFGRRVELAPGGMALIDARSSFEFERHSTGANRCFHLSGAILRDVIAEPEALCALEIDGRGGIGATIAALLDSIWQQSTVLSTSEQTLLLESLAAAIALAGGQGQRHTQRWVRPAPDAPLQRARDHISRHVGDPKLTPPNVARAAGVSLSYLQFLAQSEGTTIGKMILQTRLDACAAILANPDYAARRITDLAYDYGFSDSAHFCRSFKARFKVTATRYRKTALSGE